jgi:cation transport ATPase
MKALSLLILFTLMLGSCSMNHIEKRRYRKGWYISTIEPGGNHKKVLQNIPANATAPDCKTTSENIGIPDTAAVVDYPASVSLKSDCETILPEQPEEVTSVQLVPEAQRQTPADTFIVKPERSKAKKASLEENRKWSQIYFMLSFTLFVLAVVLMFLAIGTYLIIGLTAISFIAFLCALIFSIAGIKRTSSVVNEVKQVNNKDETGGSGISVLFLVLSWLIMIASFFGTLFMGGATLVQLLLM